MQSFSLTLPKGLSKTISLLEKKSKKGKVAVLIANPQTGKILFTYAKNKIYYKTYCIGSLIKPFTALAYSKNHRLSNSFYYNCTGFKTYSHDKIGWYAPGHGLVNFVKAIAYSCNKYFYYHLASRGLSKKHFADTLDTFAIARKSQIQSLNKKQFLLAATGLKAFIQTKAINVYRAYESFFNNKTLLDKNGKFLRFINYSFPTMRLIKEGMRGVAVYGTAKELSKLKLDEEIVAKTGTAAQLIGGQYSFRETNGWVILFYPADEPFFALLVIKEKGVSKEAVLIAKKIIEKIALGNIKK